MKEKSIKKNVGRKRPKAMIFKTAIDYSEIPKTSRKFWDEAEVIMPSAKVHLSLRLDEEIVEFFKNQGPGYQSRINAVLKSYVKTRTKRV